MWTWSPGIVTRCPLVLKLKKLLNEDEWRGKVSYQDFEMEISDPSEVEVEISKGEGLTFTHHHLFGHLVTCVKWEGIHLSLSYPSLSGPFLLPWEPPLCIRPQRPCSFSSLTPVKTSALDKNLTSAIYC